MFDGSLYGNADAIITMMLLIVLADKDGNIDMTPQAIAARTSIPLQTIKKGIEFLEKPDPHSRTIAEDGRRLTRLDEHRPWGWTIVNYIKYREMRTSEERRAYWREQKRIKRSLSRNVPESPQSPPIVEVEAEVEVNTNILARNDKSSSPSLGEGIVIERIPIVGGEAEIKDSHVKELERLFPAVDVPQTLREIRAWNLANPNRRKTSRGILRHINSWMHRVQNG